MFQVSYSLSINTGLAFWYIIGLHVAEKVNDEQNTRSPCCTSKAFNPICIAAVPADNAAPVFAPIYLAISSSNLFTFSPNGAIQFVSNASFIYCCS